MNASAHQSAEQAAVYATQADAYDALVSAEDADGMLLQTLQTLLPLAGLRVADVGAGTGRFARLLAPCVAHVALVDRAPAMLEVARRRLANTGISFEIHVAEAQALPLADASFDLAVAGWVFGHFPHWMSATWRAEVDAALAEMTRVVKPGGTIVVVETLGTGHTEPRVHPVLDPYFEHLETAHGLARASIRTDYAFADVETAATVCERFFGSALAERIRAEAWARLPECTAVFSKRR